MTGAEMIAQERARQIAEEGRTPEHDASHSSSQLALAAACYAIPPSKRKGAPRLADGYGDDRGDRYRWTPWDWPWHPDHWKPTGDRIRELAKAGALIAAEIDRLQAASMTTAKRKGQDYAAD